MPPQSICLQMPDIDSGVRLNKDLCAGRQFGEPVGAVFHCDAQPLRLQGECCYYDSFDGRLFDAGLVCLTLPARQQGLALEVLDLHDGKLLGEAALTAAPKFADDLQGSGQLAELLRDVLEARALLPVLGFPCAIVATGVRDKRNKLVAQLQTVNAADGMQVCVRAIKGYQKAARQLAQLLQQHYGATPVPTAARLHGLRQHYAQGKRYTAKLGLQLCPEMTAETAARLILGRLREILLDNMPGVADNTDSEFLHDFRVAVRKARTALGQLKGVFPEQDRQRQREFLAWLGQITGPVRDWDVYLLNFPHYKAALPETIRDDLDPLHDFLLEKQCAAQQQLAIELSSARCVEGLAGWAEFVEATSMPGVGTATPAHAGDPVTEYAKRRIWRLYKRALRDSEALHEGAEAEPLHELRKTCKKLRYLLEFFHNLFPAESLPGLLKTLKSFQEVLGELQDYEVQEQGLKHFSEEMLGSSVPAATFLALGVLVQHLEVRRQAAREEFAKRRKAFLGSGHRLAFAPTHCGDQP